MRWPLAEGWVSAVPNFSEQRKVRGVGTPDTFNDCLSSAKTTREGAKFRRPDVPVAADETWQNVTTFLSAPLCLQSRHLTRITKLT